MKYIVTSVVGGVIERPEVEYKNMQLVEADSEIEAENKYTKENKKDNFIGICIGEYDEVKDLLIIKDAYRRMGLLGIKK